MSLLPLFFSALEKETKARGSYQVSSSARYMTLPTAPIESVDLPHPKRATKKTEQVYLLARWPPCILSKQFVYNV
jgi:hypothetical protein